MTSFWRKSEEKSGNERMGLAFALRRPIHSGWASVSYSVLGIVTLLTLFLVEMNAASLEGNSNGRLSYGPDAHKTEEYLRRLDVAWFERNGSNYANPKFSPSRLGIPLGKLDILSDYDFERVADIRRDLKGVDRKRVLQEIFEEVSRSASTNTEKHLAILKFLHKSSFHNTHLQPLERDGQSIMDPLVLLALGEMHCGNVARLAVDLFDSVGIRGRLVQMGGHVIAEIYYDNAWHYLDADIFGNGETLVKEDRTIPSVLELSKEPYQVDALGHYREPRYRGEARKDSTRYPSWPFFGKGAYGEHKGLPVHYVKTATESEERNKYYGWNHYLIRTDNERVLHEFEPFYQPGAVTLTRIDLNDDPQQTNVVHIEWSKALDRDEDLLGYKVFVSRHSRGWGYGQYTGPADVSQFVSHSDGWKPEMYEKMYQVPPHEVALVTTKYPYVDLSLLPGTAYFITVMPYDRHGEEVGKVLYHMSDEIRVHVKTRA